MFSRGGKPRKSNYSLEKQLWYKNLSTKQLIYPIKPNIPCLTRILNQPEEKLYGSAVLALNLLDIALNLLDIYWILDIGYEIFM